MQSCELVATITAIACAIANNYSEDEINVLASAFSQLGDTLETIAAQEARIANSIDSIKKDSCPKDATDNNCKTDSADSKQKNTGCSNPKC